MRLFNLWSILQNRVEVCLDNEVKGTRLYHRLVEYATSVYQIMETKQHLGILTHNDSIVVVMRAGQPLGLALNSITDLPVSFIGSVRSEDLSVDISYTNIYPSKRPIITDGWIATGETLANVIRTLEVVDDVEQIDILSVIASRHAIERLEKIEVVGDVYVGWVASGKHSDLGLGLNEKGYIVPPPPYKPRDIGDDLFGGKRNE